MDEVAVEFIERPDLDDPVLVEGLPGVGNVGKIGVDHLVETLDAVHFATIHSVHLPAQVIIDDKGVASMVSHQLHYHKRKGGDIIFLTGDYQAVNHGGQYSMADTVLEICESLGAKSLYTLGGYSVGHFVEKPRVFGAVNSEALLERLKDFGVVIGESEPGGGIVGASGLLLGLGARRGMDGICLMGETHGYMADPSSARAVLEVLLEMLGFTVDLEDLDRKAVEVEKITTQIKGLTEVMENTGRDDVHYIR